MTSMNASSSSVKDSEEHKMLSTNDLSAGEDQSNKTGTEYQDSYSDDEDAVYVPFEY